MLVVIISFIIRLQRYNKNLKYSYYYFKKKYQQIFAKRFGNTTSCTWDGLL